MDTGGRENWSNDGKLRSYLLGKKKKSFSKLICWCSRVCETLLHLGHRRSSTSTLNLQLYSADLISVADTVRLITDFKIS